MSSGLIVGLELLVVLGVVLGLAVWDLLRLRRERKSAPAPDPLDRTGPSEPSA